MTIDEMFGQSATLTLLGMGIVFSFLVIMIITITVAGKVIHALGWDKDLQKAAQVAAPTVSNNNTAQNGAIAAAITAAVNEYRKTNP